MKFILKYIFTIAVIFISTILSAQNKQNVRYFSGISLDEDLTTISKVFVKRTAEGTKLTYVISDEDCVNYSYPDVVGIKFTENYYLNEKNGKIRGGQGLIKEIKEYFINEDFYDLELKGYSDGGYLVRRLYLFEDEKKSSFKRYDLQNNQIYLLKKNKNGVMQGAYIGLQTENTNYDENAKRYKTQNQSYIFGRPFVKFGLFDSESWKFTNGVLFVHTDNKLIHDNGWRKIVAPIVNGLPLGPGAMYTWSVSEDADTHIYIGNVNGLNFESGEVFGYNWEGKKSADCKCHQTVLSCRDLIPTIAEKKWEEYSVAFGAVAIGTAALLKAVAKNIGPLPTQPQGVDNQCYTVKEKKQKDLLKTSLLWIQVECGKYKNIKELVYVTKDQGQTYDKDRFWTRQGITKSGYYEYHSSLSGDSYFFKGEDLEKVIKEECSCRDY